MSQKNLKEPIEKSKKSQKGEIRPTILINREMPERFTQGDFYKDITIIESMAEDEFKVAIHEIEYPLSILLNQDCDLNSDYRSKLRNNQPDNKKINHDKEILWLIFAPVYFFEDFLVGEHLIKVDMKMSRLEDRSFLRKIKQNEIPRYHYLKFKDEERIPEMIIDFKHFYTISNNVFSTQRERCFQFTVQPLFRELLSQRFANYLSRIGLPEI